MGREPRTTLIDVADPVVLAARRPLLIAHRGGVLGPAAPENSLAAIRRAADHGYDLVELDVTRPRDDEPVLFHERDGTLWRNCGVAGRLVDHTARELATLRYRATAAPIATLADALALCRARHLGVMLDIKVRPGTRVTPGFLRRIGALLVAHGLTAATLIATDLPLAQALLADCGRFPVPADEARRVARGERVPLAGRFWFGLPEELLDDAVPTYQGLGALVLPAINTFRYPPHAHLALARADVARLHAARVDGFQFDAIYGPLFGLADAAEH